VELLPPLWLPELPGVPLFGIAELECAPTYVDALSYGRASSTPLRSKSPRCPPSDLLENAAVDEGLIGPVAGVSKISGLPPSLITSVRNFSYVSTSEDWRTKGGGMGTDSDDGIADDEDALALDEADDEGAAGAT
jgi:hypothetical protein